VPRAGSAGKVWCGVIRKDRVIAVRNDRHHVDEEYELVGLLGET
jgi:hypothetical protein